MLNRGVGYLLGKPDLATDANPLGTGDDRRRVLRAPSAALKADRKIKFQIMKDLNQAPLGDIATIYADLNKHLTRLNVGAGAQLVAAPRNRGGAADRTPREDARQGAGAAARRVRGRRDGDVQAHVRQRHAVGGAAGAAVRRRAARAAHAAADFGGGYAVRRIRRRTATCRRSACRARQSRTFAPMRPTPSGYVPGAPIISTADLHEGLTRLQAGQTDFDVGGAAVGFSGIPQGLHNVLRDLQESPLGAKANQLESMTIEMVAMLFDFIFETKDLPDGIKALLARLQIPVLKAAMLDGAFFAKKSHPSRLLVNELAQAGLGWSPVMGQEDPLYRKIDAIVHQILDDFSDDLAIFDEQRVELEAFLAEEEKAAEENIQSTAEEINQKDRQQIATVVAQGRDREAHRGVARCRTSSRRSCARTGRARCEHVYLRRGRGERSAGAPA